MLGHWCVAKVPLDSVSGKVDEILRSTVMKKYVTVYNHKTSRIGIVNYDSVWRTSESCKDDLALSAPKIQTGVVTVTMKLRQHAERFQFR